MVRRRSQVLIAGALGAGAGGAERAASVFGLAEKEFGRGAGASALGDEEDRPGMYLTVDEARRNSIAKYTYDAGQARPHAAANDSNPYAHASIATTASANGHSITGQSLSSSPEHLRPDGAPRATGTEPRRNSILRYAEPPITRDQERSIRRES